MALPFPHLVEMPKPKSVVPCYIVCHCCVSVNTDEVDQGKAIWIIRVQTGYDSGSKTNSTFCFWNCGHIRHRSIVPYVNQDSWWTALLLTVNQAVVDRVYIMFLVRDIILEAPKKKQSILSRIRFPVNARGARKITSRSIIFPMWRVHDRSCLSRPSYPLWPSSSSVLLFAAFVNVFLPSVCLVRVKISKPSFFVVCSRNFSRVFLIPSISVVFHHFLSSLLVPSVAFSLAICRTYISVTSIFLRIRGEIVHYSLPDKRMDIT